jgi:hypothetical protein
LETQIEQVVQPDQQYNVVVPVSEMKARERSSTGEKEAAFLAKKSIKEFFLQGTEFASR